jgi:exosortase E/protease (VPEID-CTERM system)
LLVAELVGLTLRFDAASLAEAEGGWIKFLSYARVVPEILLATLAAFVVMRIDRLQELAVGFVAQAAHHVGRCRFVVLHLVAFAGLVYLTAAIFDDEPARESHTSFVMLALWAGFATATLLCWMAALAPTHCWLGLAKRECGSLAVAACIGFGAWSAGRFVQGLWEPLGDSTFFLAERLLGLFEQQVIGHPADRILGTRTFSVAISPACSGYEGIGMVAVFLAAFLWIFRKSLRFPQALILIPVGLLCIWFANALRIAALVVLGTHWSRQVAVGGFHSQAGWIAFNVIALGLVTLSFRSPFFSRVHLVAPLAGHTNVAPAYLVPFLAIIATGMVSSALQPPGFDQFYPARVLAGGAALWAFRGFYRNLEWKWSWHAVAAGALVFLAWIALDQMHAATNSTSLGSQLARLPPVWAAAWLGFRLVGAVITVPIAEELAFRGYVMRWIGGVGLSEQNYARCSWFAIIVSSVLFGLLHGRWLAGTLAGIVYALVVRRRGQLGDAIVAHSVTNLLIAEFVLLFDAWWLW